MYSLAFLPSSVPSLTLARNMSPVEMNGSRKSIRRRSACVPFPAPGGPNRIKLSSGTVADSNRQRVPARSNDRRVRRAATGPGRKSFLDAQDLGLLGREVVVTQHTAVAQIGEL